MDPRCRTRSIVNSAKGQHCGYGNDGDGCAGNINGAESAVDVKETMDSEGIPWFIEVSHDVLCIVDAICESAGCARNINGIEGTPDVDVTVSWSCKIPITSNDLPGVMLGSAVFTVSQP